MDKHNYLSDVFKNDSLVNGDVSQTLTYKNIKSYPSVNSTNGGQIHSEENVRWLTRQFTKKPFVIPYDNNEQFNEFWYEGAVINAGKTNGGMVNIDGYIINTADNTAKTTFDNTEDTYLSSTGPNGYIMHQKLQRGINEILEQLGSTIGDYTSLLISQFEPNISENMTKLANTLSYNYKLYLNEDVSSIDPLTIFEHLSRAVTSASDTDYVVKSGSKILTYTGTLANYIHDNFDIDAIITAVASTTPNEYNKYIISITDNSTEPNYEYVITYKTFYGILTDKFKPLKSTSTDNYISTLYLKDILGLYFIWQTESSRVTTTAYPSTLDTNINFIQDTITPNRDEVQMANELALEQSVLYDTTNSYSVIDSADPNYGDFVNATTDAIQIPSGIYSNLDMSQMYMRKSTATVPTPNDITTIYKDTVYNGAFDVVNATTIIDIFKYYKGSALAQSDFTHDVYHTGPLSNLCDWYYCLPLNTLHTNCKSILCTTAGDKTIEIGFMTSSGALMAQNYEYTIKTGDTTVTNVLIEGYVSFFRRLVAMVCPSVDLNALPPTNTYNSREWNKVLRDFQCGTITSDISGLTPTEQTMFNEIFNNEPITFESLYNTFIAPYINLHIQTAWSSLYNLDVDVDVHPNGQDYAKYKTRWGYNIINQHRDGTISVDDDVALLSDHWRQYPHVNLQVNHEYIELNEDDNTNITWNIPKYLSYFYNQAPDNIRLANYAYKNDYTQWAEQLGFYSQIDLYNVTNKYSVCEDYISYLKKCACRGWDDTFNDKLYNHADVMTDLLNIKYRVTNLTRDTYGFNTVDHIIDRVVKYVKIDTSTAEGQDIYNNLTETATSPYDVHISDLCGIEPGYINNVAIRLDNLCPHRINHDESTYYYLNSTTPASTINNQENPTAPYLYDLWLTTYSTVEYDGLQTRGLSGYSLTGHSQGMTTYIPMVFRLFKDSQNYLNGIKNDGSSIHAGITVDYKFPVDIEVDDFWFANTWLSNICWVSTWEIESHSSDYPKSTDGMINYLDVRNKTILSIDQIYNVDEYGNYSNLTSVINNYFAIDNTRLYNVIDTWVNEEPQFTFLQAVPTAITENSITSIVLQYDNIEVHGLETGITELQKQISHITPIYDTAITVEPGIPGGSTTLELQNNKYFDTGSSLISAINLKFAYEFNSAVDNFIKGIDTNVSKIFKSTVCVTIPDKCELRLTNSVYNKETGKNVINNYIPINWSSNCPIVDCKFRLDNSLDIDNVPRSVTNDYITIFNTTPNKTCKALIDIKVSYNNIANRADAYCEISILNDATQLTSSDMSYIIQKNNSLDNLTWSEVSDYTKKGLAPKLWNLGDIKTFDVTYNNLLTPITVSIPAKIIGFNQDGPNTITWMTNRNIYDITSGAIINRFGTELRTDYNDGYNPTTARVEDYGVSPIWSWLNDDTQATSICQLVNSEMKSIILPARKITRPLYLVQHTIPAQNPGDPPTTGYHKYGTDSTTHKSWGFYKYYLTKQFTNFSQDTDYEVPIGQFDKYKDYGSPNTALTETGGDPFWLPSIYELGLTPTDTAEQDALANACDVNSTYFESSALVYNSLRTDPHGNSDGGQHTSANIHTDCIQCGLVTYDYFKLPESEQDLRTGFICRDYYAVKSDDVDPLDPDANFTTEKPEDLYNKYKTASRAFYYTTLVANTDDPTKYHLEIEDRTTASANQHATGFCFVTH